MTNSKMYNVMSHYIMYFVMKNVPKNMKKEKNKKRESAIEVWKRKNLLFWCRGGEIKAGSKTELVFNSDMEIEEQ